MQLISIQNDNFIERLAVYYHYHNIKEKLLLTFSDFMECVESGRWETFVEGKKELFNKTYVYESKHYLGELFIDDMRGYAMRITDVFTKEEKVHYFGTHTKAREAAIKTFNIFKKEAP